MFTDMVGYAALAQGDDKLALELLEEHRRLLREIFPRFNGTEIKTIGDGFLVEFNSALEAAQCAIEIQRTLAKRNHDVTADRRIELKIGLHIGDVVHRGGDVYGDGVNIASRIEPLAGAGGICVSMDVERQIRNALEARFEKLAPTELKNISVAMDLFRIVLPWEQGAKTEGRMKNAEKSMSGRSFPASRLAWIGTIVLAGVGAGWWFAHQSSKQVAGSPSVSTSRAAPSTAPAVDQKSIAVLPFVDMSEKKDEEYFADGLSEELIGMLTTVPELKVPARTSSFYFKGKQTTIADIAKALGVAHVLEGSVRKSGNTLRITAQLIRVDNGYHVWSETYDRKLDDIFKIQDDIARSVVKALKVHFLPMRQPSAREQLHTGDLAAVDLYVQGRQSYNQGDTAGYQRAVTAFRASTVLDPRYGAAYADLALAQFWLTDDSTLGDLAADVAGFDSALAAAEKAVALAPGLAAGYSARGFLRSATRFDFAGAQADLDKALALSPGDANVLHRSAILLA